MKFTSRYQKLKKFENKKLYKDKKLTLNARILKVITVRIANTRMYFINLCYH